MRALRSPAYTMSEMWSGRSHFFWYSLVVLNRMESTGLRNRIQLSQATADLLIKAGKQSWITRRSDEVEAKGKGRMQTYWLKCSVPFPMTKPTIKARSSPPPERTASESDEESTQHKDFDEDITKDDL